MNIDLINNALATEAGTFSKTDLSKFYEQFMATAQEANINLSQQLNALSSKTNDSLLAQIMLSLGFDHLASAQALLKVNFGGQIISIIPCLCDAGFWIIIGLPRPASIFASFVFVSSPLFFMGKSLIPGTWWLGSYIDTGVPIPCAQPPVCEPVGAGYEVFMAGTSL